MDETLDPRVVKVMLAIRDVETAGIQGDKKYTTYGDNGSSYGAYQWNNGKKKLKPGELPANFVAAAKKFGLDPTDFSPKNQNKVAYAQIKEYKDKGYQPEEIAARWNGAHIDKNSGRYTYNNPKYGEKFRAALASGTGMAISNPTEQTASAGGSFPGLMTASADTIEQPQPAQRGLLEKTADRVNSIFPGKQIGTAVSSNIRGLLALAKGDLDTFKEEADFVGREIGPKKILGDAVGSIALPASMAVAPASGLLKSAAQFAGFSGASAGGASAARGGSIGEVAKDTFTGAATGAALGGTFNLLGRALSKAGPAVLSFTSGVPKPAIQQAAGNPAVAKVGTKVSVEKIRKEATKSLSSLFKDLGKEFEAGLKEVKGKTGQTKVGMTFNDKGFIASSKKIQSNLTSYARDFAREFRLGTKATPEGIEINFSKSPIVKAGEKSAVQEAFTTISTWKDFSARGMQDLAERIGALRNFESGAKTESSAIVGKIYDKIAKQIIPEIYPDLAKLRTNYSMNRRVLDEISDVLGANNKTPVKIQTSITRLSNLYKEDKEAYVRAIGELSKRSGVDFLSLLAGTEFQKVLPGFIRGLGGAGVVGVGASVLNPYLLLLAPLFSPRAAGFISRNAPAVADTTSRATRGAAQIITPALQD